MDFLISKVFLSFKDIGEGFELIFPNIMLYQDESLPEIPKGLVLYMIKILGQSNIKKALQ